jgi:hypothetical protein
MNIINPIVKFFLKVDTHVVKEFFAFIEPEGSSLDHHWTDLEPVESSPYLYTLFQDPFQYLPIYGLVSKEISFLEIF